MAPVQYASLPKLLVLVAASLMAGFVAVLGALRSLIKVGPRRFFTRQHWDARPMVLDDPDLGTHHYARLTNIRLHYVSKGHEGRPLLLLLHGFPEIWYSWRFQIKEFANVFRVVAVDMRGYGESEKPEGIAQYHPDKLTSDIKELIEHLGYKKCFLAGNDWGGSVAWRFAAQYPEMTQKLVICNCPHIAAYTKFVRTHVSQLLKSWYMFVFQLPLLPEFLLGANDFGILRKAFRSPEDGIKARNLTEEDLEAFLYSFQDRGERNTPVNYYRASFRYKTDTIPSVRVKSPTMIIWGTRDRYLDKAMVELSKEYVDGECKACYIEGASHWVQQDEPELVNKYMRAFLLEQKDG